MADSKTVFRRKTVERVSSPEQLTDYLRVTNLGIWVLLSAVILLLAGIFAWSMIGTLETKAEVKVIVKNNTAQVVPLGADTLQEGMTLRVSGRDCQLSSAQTDAYGRSVATAQLDLPDGSYDGVVVVETVRAIDFLIERR